MGYNRIRGCGAPPLHNPGHAEDQEMAEARTHREGRTREVRGGECGNLKRE